MAKKGVIKNLFDEEPEYEWDNQWQGMPYYNPEAEEPPFYEVIVRVRNKEDFDKLKAIMNQNMTSRTKAVWFPEKPNRKMAGVAYRDEESIEAEDEG